MTRLIGTDAITHASERIGVSSIHPGTIRVEMVENQQRTSADNLVAARIANGAGRS